MIYLNKLLFANGYVSCPWTTICKYVYWLQHISAANVPLFINVQCHFKINNNMKHEEKKSYGEASTHNIMFWVLASWYPLPTVCLGELVGRSFNMVHPLVIFLGWYLGAAP